MILIYKFNEGGDHSGRSLQRAIASGRRSRRRKQQPDHSWYGFDRSKLGYIGRASDRRGFHFN